MFRPETSRYECPDCPKTFSTDGYWLRHWNKYHANTDEPEPSAGQQAQPPTQRQKKVEYRPTRKDGDENERPIEHRPKPAMKPTKPKSSAHRAPLKPKRSNPVASPRNTGAAAHSAGRRPDAASASSADLDTDPFAHPAVQAKIDLLEKEFAVVWDGYIELARLFHRTHGGEPDSDNDASGPSTKRRRTSTSTPTSLSPEDEAVLAEAAGRLVYLHKPFLSDADLDALNGVVSSGNPVRVGAAVELRRTVRGLLPAGPRWDDLTREDLVVLQDRVNRHRRKVTHVVRLHLVDILGVRLGDLVGGDDEAGDKMRAQLTEDGGLAWTYAGPRENGFGLQSDSVTRAISTILYGPRSIAMTTAAERRTAGKSSKGAVWNVDCITPQLVALAVTIVTSCLRNEKQFLIADDPRNANFQLFNRVVELLGPSSSGFSSDDIEHVLGRLGRELIPAERAGAGQGEEEREEGSEGGPSGALGGVERVGEGGLDSEEEAMMRPPPAGSCLLCPPRTT
ncbi:uncharacterized protein RHOBADRAFT_52039 [Rhodotorula graminis WP1]|uniref:C2H2-type domain-containing protein n=1 Tax=Rhodotorula graminis (strain WP1) TaxID=578459 RepID=A0A194S928_RHOGW|nr:uncharacterized protein RHOBADRAFT_52039 [Rhodotorula graminis WP1]KPV77084.1 hypothetical protein RHOBADRAFT_52039 [Rhodotorula graminis WP1]